MAEREVAWRVFAEEYNASTCELSGEGERAPSYVVTPLGAKINRLYVVGVITDVENVGTSEEPMWRARLSDPTNTYYLSAGQFQSQASTILSKFRPPGFAAVIGKTRVYKPEEGTIYLSIRPEVIKSVDSQLRDFWILETCKNLKKRIEAMQEALKMEPLTKEELFSLGYSENLVDGIITAIQHYKQIDLERYEAMLVDALKYLISEAQESKSEEPEAVEVEIPAHKEEVEKKKALELEVLEEKILTILERLDRDSKGVVWESLAENAKKEGIKREQLEELINSLLDKGLVYEPVLGRIKRI